MGQITQSCWPTADSDMNKTHFFVGACQHRVLLWAMVHRHGSTWNRSFDQEHKFMVTNKVFLSTGYFMRSIFYFNGNKSRLDSVYVSSYIFLQVTTCALATKVAPFELLHLWISYHLHLKKKKLTSSERLIMNCFNIPCFLQNLILCLIQ